MPINESLNNGHKYQVNSRRLDIDGKLYESFALDIFGKRGLKGLAVPLKNEKEFRVISTDDISALYELTGEIIKDIQSELCNKYGKYVKHKQSSAQVYWTGLRERKLHIEGEAVLFDERQPSNISKIFVYDKENNFFLPTIYGGMYPILPNFADTPQDFGKIAWLMNNAFWHNESIFINLEKEKPILAADYQKDGETELNVFNSVSYSELHKKSAKEDIREEFAEAISHAREELHRQSIKKLEEITADLICIASGLKGDSTKAVMKIETFHLA